MVGDQERGGGGSSLARGRHQTGQPGTHDKVPLAGPGWWVEGGTVNTLESYYQRKKNSLFMSHNKVARRNYMGPHHPYSSMYTISSGLISLERQKAFTTEQK